MKRLSRVIEVEGHRTCVEQTGNGPPLVFLPSTLVRFKTYRRLTDVLQRRFTIYGIELPGSGAGSKLREPWSFEQYGTFLVRLVESLAPSPVTLLAHSNSAPAAVLASTKSHYISHLILADPTGFVPSPIWWLVVGRFFDGILEAPFSLTALRDVLFNTFQHAQTVFRQIRLASETDLTNIAPLIRPRTLIAWGKRDYTWPIAAAKRLHAVLPRSSLYISREGSHDWLVTHPTEFASAVERFVNDP